MRKVCFVFEMGHVDIYDSIMNIIGQFKPFGKTKNSDLEKIQHNVGTW